MIPSERLRKLKSLHELGAAIKRQERELKRGEPLRSAMPRLLYLRRLELAGVTMTAAELAEHKKLEHEVQKDADDYNAGNASRDWTK